jgi:hypothetical protein
MDSLVIKFVSPIIVVSVISLLVVFRAFCKSMSRRAAVANVAMPGGAPFLKMADTKTVVILRVLHIGRIGGDFHVRGRGSGC